MSSKPGVDNPARKSTEVTRPEQRQLGHRQLELRRLLLPRQRIAVEGVRHQPVQPVEPLSHVHRLGIGKHPQRPCRPDHPSTRSRYAAVSASSPSTRHPPGVTKVSSAAWPMQPPAAPTPDSAHQLPSPNPATNITQHNPGLAEDLRCKSVRRAGRGDRRAGGGVKSAGRRAPEQGTFGVRTKLQWRHSRGKF